MSQIPKKVTIALFEAYCRKREVDGKEIIAKISGCPVKLIVASTPESQMKGYMGADTAPNEGEGMIFIYDKPMPLSFWMKQVKFPLDIIFFDSDMCYVSHETMDPAHDVPDERIPHYHSQAPARFAVELPAGWCEKNMRPDCKLEI